MKKLLTLLLLAFAFVVASPRVALAESSAAERMAERAIVLVETMAGIVDRDTRDCDKMGTELDKFANDKSRSNPLANTIVQLNRSFTTFFRETAVEVPDSLMTSTLENIAARLASSTAALLVTNECDSITNQKDIAQTIADGTAFTLRSQSNWKAPLIGLGCLCPFICSLALYRGGQLHIDNVTLSESVNCENRERG